MFSCRCWCPRTRGLFLVTPRPPPGPAALLQVPFPKGSAGPGLVGDSSVTRGRSELAHLLFDVMEPRSFRGGGRSSGVCRAGKRSLFSTQTRVLLSPAEEIQESSSGLQTAGEGFVFFLCPGELCPALKLPSFPI